MPTVRTETWNGYQIRFVEKESGQNKEIHANRKTKGVKNREKTPPAKLAAVAYA